MKRALCCIAALAVLTGAVDAEPVATSAAFARAFDENHALSRLVMLLSPT